MSMVPQQARWDPLNCDLYSLAGLSVDQMMWAWLVRRDLLCRQNPQNGTTYKHQILCKDWYNFNETHVANGQWA